LGRAHLKTRLGLVHALIPGTMIKARSIQDEVDSFFMTKPMRMAKVTKLWRGEIRSSSSKLGGALKYSWNLGELSLIVPRDLPEQNTPELVPVTISFGAGWWGTNEFRQQTFDYQPATLKGTIRDASSDGLQPGDIVYGHIESFTERLSKNVTRAGFIRIMFIVKERTKVHIEGVYKSTGLFGASMPEYDAGIFKLDLMG